MNVKWVIFVPTLELNSDLLFCLRECLDAMGATVNTVDKNQDVVTITSDAKTAKRLHIFAAEFSPKAKLAVYA